MDAAEYAEEVAVVTAGLVKRVLRFASQFLRSTPVAWADWENFLDMLYPHVWDARSETARIARRFYDSERDRLNLPQHPVLLPGYRRDWFGAAMEPARQVAMGAGTPDAAATQVALRAAKEAENGGRRSMIQAVEDQDDREAIAWARVATGRETCEWCLMLISRGPAYLSAEGAGLNLDDTSATSLWRAGDEEGLREAMVEWHTGCDCKVVPVFNRSSWPGRDEYLKASAIWKKYSRMVDNDPSLLIPQNGNQRVSGDREWRRHEAVLAAIRRAFYSGELSPGEYAIAA